MKKRKKLLCIFLILLFVFPNVNLTPVFAASSKDIVVNIPDANLRNGILENLGKDSDYSPTISDMESLTSLYVINYNDPEDEQVSSLEGLQYCTNLKTLNLSDNKITDISPLSDLSNLSTLYISTNEISDISPLKNLSNLSKLELSWNEISDISPLTHLSSLTELGLTGNNISDISFLSNLSKLTRLYLSCNKISNISPLASLSNLTFLSLSSNEISDISPLANLSNLKENSLRLGSQKISLPAKPYLSSLSIENPLKDLDKTPITSMSNISNNGYYDKNTNTINWVNLDKTDFVSFEFSKDVKIGHASGTFCGDVINDLTCDTTPSKTIIQDENLKAAILDALHKDADYNITKGDLKTITYLNAGHKNIKSLEGLEYCTNLVYLNLDHNEISNISPLTNLSKLGVLNLGYNQIYDISPLADLSNLDSLNLENQVIWLCAKSYNGSINIKNPLKYLDKSPVTSISNISDNGYYDEAANSIKWTDLKNNTTVSYDFSRYVKVGTEVSLCSPFSGQVKIKLL